MNKSRKPISELGLDQLMSQAGLEPPQDFEQRVIARLVGFNALPRASAVQHVSPREQRQAIAGQSHATQWLTPLRWLAMLGGGAFALSELLAFMFGLWTVSTAL
jgi:hypothetical protein